MGTLGSMVFSTPSRGFHTDGTITNLYRVLVVGALSIAGLGGPATDARAQRSEPRAAGGPAAGAAAGNAATDRAALEALYHATGGPSWRNSTNWLSDAPLDEWFGVETDSGGRVTRLRLLGDLDADNGNLTGAIPPELGDLAALQELNLSQNDLTGAIPSELGVLTNLEELSLRWNRLTGTIPPALGNLANLEDLSLDINRLTGAIPSELGNLANLEWLALSRNGLTGTIPPALGNLANLEWLRLDFNQLTGSIPPALGNLANLRSLRLSFNDLTGTIPPELERLVDLESLWLGRNRLTGVIPPQLGNLANLRHLSLGSNDLIGAIPRNLMHLPLDRLAIDGTGVCVPADAEFQAWVSALPSFESSGLTCEGLLASFTRASYVVAEGGAVPVTVRLSAASPPGRAVTIALTATPGGGATAADYGGVPASVTFGPTDTERTFQVAAVTDGVSDEGETVILGIGEPLPHGVAAGNPATARVTLLDHEPVDLVARDREALEALYHATDGPNWFRRTNWLSDEPLSAWAGVRTNGEGRVTWLALDRNRLRGVLPAALANLTELEELYLHRNHLRGEIPADLERLANLDSLALSNNELSGGIPPHLGNLANLEALWLQANRLSGTIPPDLGRLEKLERLILDDNPLSGPMPQSLTALSGLAWLAIEGTGVCVPDDAAFQTWLAGIPNFRSSGLTCGVPVPVTVAFGSAGYTVAEGESVPVAVLSSQAPRRTMTIPLTATPGGGATAADYAGVPSSLTFGAAEVFRIFQVEAHADAELDTGETITLGIGLPLPDGVTPATPATATLTLADDPDGGAADRAVLEVLYHATGGETWRNSTNWLSDAPLDEWYGVETDNSGRVTRLRLVGGLDADNGNLTGAIPPELGDLVALQELDLSQNDLTGAIPPELGALTNLEELSLRWNRLTGTIPPALGNLVNLERLSLDINRLTGPIPPALGNLVDLERLSLGRNRLTGPIPSALGNLANLERLSLPFNQLTGAIPPELGRLADLAALVLVGNHLMGAIPAELGSLANLQQLGVSFNSGLSGPFPLPLRSPLSSVDLRFTQVCVPPTNDAFEAWVATARFRPSGFTCGVPAPAMSAIDVAVFYTPAARAATGGTAAIEAEIDLMIAETNQAYRDSGVHQRVLLAARQEVGYTEADWAGTDVNRLMDPAAATWTGSTRYATGWGRTSSI